MSTKTYLVTRPRTNATTTLTTMQGMGLNVLHEPLLNIEPLPQSHPESISMTLFDGLIITSINAIPVLDQQWQHQRQGIPVFTTGKQTASAMQAIGFDNVSPHPGSALALSNWIIEKHQTSAASLNLLYPCAEQTAHDLPKLLSKGGIACTPWPVYRAIEADAFTDSTHQALANNEIDGVLLYSARTARCFARLLNDSHLNSPSLFVLSRDIAQSLPTSLQRKCHFPEKPDEAALLALLTKA